MGCARSDNTMHTHPLKVAAAVKLALATACLYVPVTQAAQSDNDTTDNLLTPVEVTGSRTASVARELPTGTLILDRDTIEAMPANNLADVLDTLGGVQVRCFMLAQNLLAGHCYGIDNLMQRDAPATSDRS